MSPIPINDSEAGSGTVELVPDAPAFAKKMVSLPPAEGPAVVPAEELTPTRFEALEKAPAATAAACCAASSTTRKPEFPVPCAVKVSKHPPPPLATIGPPDVAWQPKPEVSYRNVPVGE
jgi:hypothetical protein